MTLRTLFFLVLSSIATPLSFAEPALPWWVEGSFASIDLSALKSVNSEDQQIITLEQDVFTLINNAASAYNVDYALLRALVAQESNYDPAAKSHAGAMGLGQLMPATAKWCGADPWHRVENLDCAAKLLSTLLKRYDGDEALALAAYNAGEPAVDKYGGIPPYAETEDYVERVLIKAGRYMEPES